MNNMRQVQSLLGLVVVVTLAAACGAPVATPTPVSPGATSIPTKDTPIPPPNTPLAVTSTPVPLTDTPEPAPTVLHLPAGKILERARVAQEQLRSASVSFEQETVAPGGSIVIECDGGVELPDRVLLACNTAGTQIEMVMVSATEGFMRRAGDKLWLKMPAQALDNPLEQATLDQFDNDAQVVGEEAIEGVDSYVVESSLDLGKLFNADPQVLQVFNLQDSYGSIKVWIGKDDFLSRRYEIDFTLAGTEVEVESKAVLSQGAFDAPVTFPEPAPYASQVTMTTSDPVYQIAFSPDGQTLAACDDDAFIYLWSTQDPEVGSRFIDHPELLNQQEGETSFLAADFYSLTFSPDSQVLAAGSLGEVLLYALANLAAEPESLEVASGIDVNAVAYSPDGEILAAGGDDGLIYVWNMSEPGASSRILKGHEAAIRDLVFLPDGETLVSASEDTTIRLWALNDLRAEPTVLTGHKMPVYNVDVSANGTTLLSVGFKEPVYAWSMETPDSQPDLLIKAEVPEIGKYPTLALAVSPDDKLMATSEVFGEVRLWASPDFDQPYATFSTGNQYDIMSLDFSPDGRYLAAGQGSNMVHIWDLAPETPTKKAGEATTVNGLTAEEMLARNSEAMAALDTVRVTMTVDDENRNPAGESGALTTQMMTATAELQLPGDVHGWLETQGKTQEILQLDGGPVHVRGEPDENWKLRDGSPALEPTLSHDFLALSTPGTLARMSQFEGMESAGDDEPYQITFAVRPREFFALEPMMTNLASATRTQVTGKAWISRKNLLTQRVLYEVTLKTPYVNETVTYVLELDAFDEPVDIPNLKE